MAGTMIKRSNQNLEPYAVMEVTLVKGVAVPTHVGGTKEEYDSLQNEINFGLHDPRKPGGMKVFTWSDGRKLLNVLPFFYRTPYLWAEPLP